MTSARARTQLHAFTAKRDPTIAAAYVGSSAMLAPPELFHLLTDCRLGDMLLMEQVDCLSRLLATAQHNAGGAGMPWRSILSPYANVRVKTPATMNVRYKGAAKAD